MALPSIGKNIFGVWKPKKEKWLKPSREPTATEGREIIKSARKIAAKHHPEIADTPVQVTFGEIPDPRAKEAYAIVTLSDMAEVTRIDVTIEPKYKRYPDVIKALLVHEITEAAETANRHKKEFGAWDAEGNFLGIKYRLPEKYRKQRGHPPLISIEHPEVHEKAVKTQRQYENGLPSREEIAKVGEHWSG